MVLTLILLLFQRVTAPIATNQELLQQVIEILEKRDRELVIERAYSEPFSPELLYETLRVFVKHPEIAYRQAILETGWFRSKSFLIGNNCTGMKYARTRTKNATGVYLGHARYDHWLDSVLDYATWQNYWDSLGYDMSDYYKFLDELPYATAKNYTKTLRSLDLNT